MSSIKRVGKLPYIVGHRGARGLAPENTMSAFRKGFEMKADMVECDVHLNRDGDVVVIHDDTVNRTTNGSGQIRNLSRVEIASLTIGTGEKVPLLDELLDWISKQENARIAIEVKGSLNVYPDISKRVVGLLKSYQMIHRAIVISFDAEEILQAKEECSELKTGFLLSHNPENAVALARQAKADSIWPSLKILSPGLVQLAHENGLAVYTWNANDKPDLERALEAGVDGVGTDFPDLIHRLLFQ